MLLGRVVLLGAGCALALVVGSCTTAELTPPSKQPGPPVAEPFPDTEVKARTDAYADTDPSALRDFRRVLAPFGAWLDDSAFGTVWVPDVSVVGADFMPYVSAGHWVYDEGYAWISDWDWGWLPFHYGRWIWIEGRGWAWIAGRGYSGAWVAWRTHEVGWVGWAPLPPTWTWRATMAVSIVPIAEAGFVFCATSDLFSPKVITRVVAGAPGFSVAKRTEPYLGAAGPPPSELGIPAANVVHASAGSLQRAKQWATPSTAPRLANPPTRHWVREAPLRRTPRADAPSTYRLMHGALR